jgi:F-type H+-transporting ATPase subunit b
MTRSWRGSDRPVRIVPIWRLAVGFLLAVAAWPGLAGAAAGEGGSLIEINASLIVQIVNFLVLLAVLYAIAYKPLVRSLQARSTAIQEQLAEAQAAREAAQRQLAEFEAKLQAAHAEAQATRERALHEAATLKERLAAEARQEAARLLETARAEIDQSVRRARADLKAQVGALAVDIAERLVQRSLRGEDHEQIIQQALARMDTA